MNEIRLWNQIKLVNLYTFEIDENVKRDKTVEFVTLLNLWHCWMCGTVEWDENVKLDKTIEFVTLLNVWDLWMRWECEIR